MHGKCHCTQIAHECTSKSSPMNFGGILVWFGLVCSVNVEKELPNIRRNSIAKLVETHSEMRIE